MHRHSLELRTRGRGFHDITRDVQEAVAASSVRDGLCHLFVHHTSASIIVCENADPSVRQDLERLFSRIAPDGDPMFAHDAEGPDDMPAHARTILTQVSLVL